MHWSLLANTGAAYMPSLQGVDFRDFREFPYCSMLPRPGDIAVAVEVNLRPTVSRTVCLGVRFPSGAHDQIFVFCLTNAGFLMWDTLWREDGSVIYLYNCFWALPEQSIFWVKSRRTHDHILLSPETPPNFEGQVPVFIPPRPRNRVAQLNSQALEFPFVASYDYFLLHNIHKFSSYFGNNTSPLCSQELWPLDHRSGLLSST
jgi:hypothetical protein